MRFALLGDPVAHSRSPAIHAAALQAASLDGTYEARRVDALGMEEAAVEMGDGRLDGANITMPHKRLAASLADRRTETVERLGSANTWVRRDGRIEAHSTDGHGVRFAIERAELGWDGPILVLGAGGAAAAALLALDGCELFISARKPATVTGLLESLGVGGKSKAWGEGIDGALVVNATPLGMSGEPLPGEIVGRARGLLDMVYGETMTPAVREAQRLGIPVSDGVAMLVGQALESFRLWTGVSIDPQVMVDAANLSSRLDLRPKNHQ